MPLLSLLIARILEPPDISMDIRIEIGGMLSDLCDNPEKQETDSWQTDPEGILVTFWLICDEKSAKDIWPYHSDIRKMQCDS